MICALCKGEIFDGETYCRELTYGNILHEECLQEYWIDKHMDDLYNEWKTDNTITEVRNEQLEKELYEIDNAEGF